MITKADDLMESNNALRSSKYKIKLKKKISVLT